MATTSTTDSSPIMPIIPPATDSQTVPSLDINNASSEIPTAPPPPSQQSNTILSKTKNILNDKYNKVIDVNKNFIRKIFDNTRLNPYQCNPNGLLCDPVIIYIILMTVALVFLYIFRYQLKSKLRIAFDWILISIIFTSGLLILTNLCLYQKPSKYSIPIIIIALFALYFVMV